MTENLSDKYDVLEKIGHGSFGIIRKVKRKSDGMILCRKEISYLKMSQKEREQLHAEFQILSTLRHPHIVGYYQREHLKQSQDLHLYMEYCGNGDLGRVIRELSLKNHYAEEAFVWSIFAQLVTALYRCHYGIDPPEVGKDVLGLGPTAKPKAPTGGMTILHRDLKPENVFLGDDNSVKLGDFGLSKLIQSHDFASTYVGTPFYMSPEICAAEKYTLKSDIWSLGCIIYELCTREPPFNAKSHYELVQKIKTGKVAPLPAVYSKELESVIKDCLRTNPDRRPDTAAFLNLPVVRLMRKENEVVQMSRILRKKEESLERSMREFERRIEVEKSMIKEDLDASLRREWELKARLEIDRLVNDEIQQLQSKFEQEVQARVETELQKQKKTVSFSTEKPEELGSSLAPSDFPTSSVGTGDGDFPSTTDLTEMSNHSIHSAHLSPKAPVQDVKKAARTPWARAQTMFIGTPMDVEMASPSPFAPALDQLNLSPRRGAAAKVPNVHQANIFAVASGTDRWNARDPCDFEHDSDSDDENICPSPTPGIKSTKNPFTSKSRPQLLHQTTAPVHKMKSQPVLSPSAKTTGTLPTMSSSQNLRRERSNAALRERAGDSPNRRLSRIPSATNLLAGNGNDSPSLSRKPSMTRKDFDSQPTGGLISKKGNIKGRTLVELQQARAGGRPHSGGESKCSPKRAFRDHARGVGFEEPAVWNPDCDEMPSPFIIRRKPMGRVQTIS